MILDNTRQFDEDKLKFSTTNHPQTNRQTERVNTFLEEYLKHYITANQWNWVDLLDVAQFCYNIDHFLATGMSLTELLIGQQSLILQEVSRQASRARCPAALKFARDK